MDPVSFTLALVAILLSAITFYFQFFWKRQGASLTLLIIDVHDDTFFAQLCLTNTGDTPIVLAEMIPMLFDKSYALGASPPGRDYKSSPALPVSIAPMSHCVIELRSGFQIPTWGAVRDQAPLLPDPNPGRQYILGGITLTLVTHTGRKTWGMIQLFQVVVKDKQICGSSYIDKPINLLARNVLKHA